MFGLFGGETLWLHWAQMRKSVTAFWDASLHQEENDFLSQVRFEPFKDCFNSTTIHGLSSLERMHLLPLTVQVQMPNYLRRGHRSVDQLLRRPLWLRPSQKPHTRFHIPSSARQSSSRFSNNIQSTEISVLRRSMFVWPVPRGSCHLSPACAQRTAAETHSVFEWSGCRLGK